MPIHSTAIVADSAQIDDSATIGPYCVIEGNVSIGANTVLKSHVNVEGNTTIDAHCTVYPFTSLGSAPQDLKYNGEASTLSIGEHCTIREHVTMNPGTEGGGMRTRVGRHCLFMVGAHVAHDCLVGDRVILANNATLAGHVEVGDGCVIGGLAAIHQFVRIGAHAMIGGMSGVEKDVIPFGSVIGERADLNGLNIIGMKRCNLERKNIHALRNAYKELFANTDGTLESRIDSVKEKYSTPEVAEVLSFLQSDSHRSFSAPKQA